MSDTPNMDEVICPNCAHQFRAIPQNVQAENASLREELEQVSLKHQVACDTIARMKLDDERIGAEFRVRDEVHRTVRTDRDKLREELEEANEQHRMELAAISSACFANSRTSAPPMEVTNPYWTQSYQDAVDAVAREMNQRERAEQAEARALEYKTEHAALLGTSQWQEVEIADLRDDVKRHMKIASECEERALAAEKDAGRYTDKWTHSCNALCMEIDLWIKNCPHCGKPSVDAAIAGAKHEG